MKKLYYGWWIVLATFFTLFVCAGIGFSTFTVFLKYLEADMQWSRTSLSLAPALAAIAAGFSTPLIGWAIDRYETRAVMLPGVIILSVSYMLLGKVSEVHQLYALFIISGVGLAATTLLPSQTLVSRWFERRRGRVMGLVTMASALGTVVWLPVAGRLIEVAGWRNAYYALGAAIAIVSLPLVCFIIRSSPGSMGLSLDGRGASPSDGGGPIAPETTARARERGYTVREAFGTKSFWLILCATFFVVFGSSGFGLHIVPFLSDADIPTTRAAGLWSAAHLCSIGARFIFGYLSENRQKRYFASAANVSRTVSLFTLILFSAGIAPFNAAVVMLIIVYGLGMGCNAVINPLLVSETFGIRYFGKLMGMLGIPYTIGMALGLVSGGYLYDLMSNYILAFSVFAASFLVAGVSIVLARPCMLYDRVSEGC